MILTTQALHFKYPQGESFRFPDLAIAAGEKILIMGPSGCGKSTLLSLISGALPLQSGDITLTGTTYRMLRGTALDRMRADHLGVIFQTLNLIPYLTGYQNAALGLQFSAIRRRRVLKPSDEIHRLARALGLSQQHLDSQARALSIGQQQRIAVIRALLGRPELILADEPTSALDPKSTERFIQELLGSFDPSTQGMILVSHNPALQPFFDRVIKLKGPQDV